MQNFDAMRNKRALVLAVLITGALTLTATMRAPNAISAEVPVPARKPVASSVKNAGLVDLNETLVNLRKPQKANDIPTPEQKPVTQQPTHKQLASHKDYDLTLKPLNKKDVALYAEIFALQAAGNMDAATKKISALNDHRLYGHVLYQRYMHPTAYSSTFAELKDWLDHYSDHPEAYKLYALAERKKPAGYKGQLKKPQNEIHIIRRHEPTMVKASRYVSPRNRNSAEANQVKTVNRQITALLRKDRPSNALSYLKKNASLLDNVEYDLARANIAASYLYNGKVTTAYTLASQSAQRSGVHVPKAGWIAGLAAWMQKDYDAAARNFEVVGRSNYASGWTKSAGAYWAARAHMRTGNVKMVSTWLNRAIMHPRTFYGLVATRALGRDFDFNWDVPTFTRDNYKLLASTPGGFRAMALVAAGQSAEAEAELIRLNLDDEKLRDALLAYAGYARLPGLAMRLGANVSGNDGEYYYDAALYPMGPWQPGEGYKIDPALIHAIMRQESRFDPTAVSHAGAKGLMQITPITAKAIGAELDMLDDPQTNVELGQQYLEKLLGEKVVNEDLFRLLVAYNAGPGNLSRWSRRYPDVKDPLLFIELIPVSETRTYVEHVLANYWIYRLRGGLPTPSLDAVVSGKPARYARGKRLETASLQ